MKAVNKTKRYQCHSVNSNKSKKPTVNSKSSISGKINDFLDDLALSSEDLANTLANALNDIKSLNYYQLLAKNIPHSKLLEALSYVKDTENRGEVKYKPVYFQGILRNWGFPIRFKKYGKTK